MTTSSRNTALYFRVAIVLIIIGCIIAFSIQNAAVTAVSFLFWEFTMSVTLVVLIALVTGVMIGAGFGVWFRWRRSRQE